MSKSKKYIWFCLYFLLLNFTTMNAAGILQKKKTEGGHEGCCKTILPYVGLGIPITLTIRGDLNTTTCAFPWKIKAMAKQNSDKGPDIVLGESEEFSLSDFSPIDENGLINITVELVVFDGMEDPRVGLCNTDRCGQDYAASKEFIYKIFSDEQEVDLTCPWFDHPDLDPETIELEDIIYICDCSPLSSPGDKKPNTLGPIGPRAKVTNSSPYHNSNERYQYIYPEESLSAGDVEVKIYPNPVNQKVNLLIDTNTQHDIHLQILSVDGGVMITRFLKSSDNNDKIYFNTAQLPTGIYFIKVITFEQEIVKKMSVIH